MINDKRPVYISLTQFKFPVTAIASIVHRITGMLLFLGIAYLLWLLDLALESEAGFAQATAALAAPFAKLVLWGVLSMLSYHILAGVKASVSAYIVFVLSAVLAVVTGAWIW
jgi:succinate dehydrogenase / fumarate reductase cytochrome b subunit